MATLHILNRHGDAQVTWDNTATDLTAEQEAAVQEAETVFKEFTAKGYLAYRQDAPGKATQLKEFDKSAPQIILTPQMVGG